MPEAERRRSIAVCSACKQAAIAVLSIWKGHDGASVTTTYIGKGLLSDC